jgi:predicted kinase
MQKVEVLVSIPAAGKSTYCRELMRKEPGTWKRINNDDLRSAIDLGVYSSENEKIIRSTRQYLLKEFLSQGYSVLVDNLNIGKRNWEEITKIAKEANRDVQCYEKIFYIDLEEAIERDSKREGKACVGKEVIEKWWKESGKTQLKHRHSRVEIFTKRNYTLDAPFTPAAQDKNLCPAIVSDLDGTLALFAGKRSPYDAKDCDLIDEINVAVKDTIELHYNSGTQIIFCSGREDKYEPETRRFIEKHLPNMEYKLFMRKSADMRRDSVIKEEIYRNNIEGKYFVKLVLDDRNQVVSLWRSLGLVCFQVAPGDF